MQLERIQIINFKGLRSVEFWPSSFGCLVGENNSGKCSVLQAIVHALTRSGQLAPGLYYDPAVPVEFRLVFTGVTHNHLLRLAEEHRARIGELLVGGKFELIVRYPPEQKCETTAVRRAPREQRYRDDSIVAALQGKRGDAVAEAVQESYPELAEGLGRQHNCGEAISYRTHRRFTAGGVRDDRGTAPNGHLVLDCNSTPGADLHSCG
jgi:putative ATP-dependent endonuclease of the OLD family